MFSAGEDLCLTGEYQEREIKSVEEGGREVGRAHLAAVVQAEDIHCGITGPLDCYLNW